MKPWESVQEQQEHSAYIFVRFAEPEWRILRDRGDRRLGFWGEEIAKTTTTRRRRPRLDHFLCAHQTLCACGRRCDHKEKTQHKRTGERALRAIKTSSVEGFARTLLCDQGVGWDLGERWERNNYVALVTLALADQGSIGTMSDDDPRALPKD